MPDVAFERKLRICSAWEVDPMPDVAFEWKFRRYSAWIVDTALEVSSEQELRRYFAWIGMPCQTYRPNRSCEDTLGGEYSPCQM